MSMLHTFQGSYEVLNGDVTGEIDQGDMTQILDGSTPGYTYQHNDKPSIAKQLDNAANGIELIFKGKDVTENSDFGVNIWGYRVNGSAEKICEISGIFGTGRYEDGSSFGGDIDTARYYADTLVVTSTHLTSVCVADSGNNRIAKTSFDGIGYKWLAAEFFDISGAAEAAVSGGAVTCEMAYY